MDNQSFSDFSEMASHYHTLLIIHEVIFTIFCVIGICLNITIINTVYGFNRMQTTQNIFLANWAIADIFSLLLMPTTYNIIAGLTRFMGYLPLIERVGVIMHSTEILSVAVVAIDWFLAGTFTRASGHYRKRYRYVVGTVWLFAMITIMTSLTVCRKRWHCRLEGLELLICYLLLALVILIVQPWRGIQKCRRRPIEQPALFINLASIFLLTWAFGFYNVLFLSWVVSHPLVSIIFDCLTFSTPIVNFALLYYFNNDFQACFIRALSRSSSKYVEEIPNVAESQMENGIETPMNTNASLS